MHRKQKKNPETEAKATRKSPSYGRQFYERKVPTLRIRVYFKAITYLTRKCPGLASNRRRHYTLCIDTSETRQKRRRNRGAGTTSLKTKYRLVIDPRTSPRDELKLLEGFQYQFQFWRNRLFWEGRYYCVWEDGTNGIP